METFYCEECASEFDESQIIRVPAWIFYEAEPGGSATILTCPYCGSDCINVREEEDEAED